MSEITKYICSSCGQEHEEWPVLSFNSPLSYSVLPDEIKEAIAEIDNDFCIITHANRTDRFIRGTLTQKVIGNCQDLKYSLWASLSEKNFEHYKSKFKNNDEVGYFGWLSNDIPGYEPADIPTDVLTHENGNRPDIVPHPDFDHQFVRDYYNGISTKEAEARINWLLQPPSEE